LKWKPKILFVISIWVHWLPSSNTFEWSRSQVVWQSTVVIWVKGHMSKQILYNQREVRHSTTYNPDKILSKNTKFIIYQFKWWNASGKDHRTFDLMEHSPNKMPGPSQIIYVCRDQVSTMMPRYWLEKRQRRCPTIKIVWISLRKYRCPVVQTHNLAKISVECLRPKGRLEVRGYYRKVWICSLFWKCGLFKTKSQSYKTYIQYLVIHTIQ